MHFPGAGHRNRASVGQHLHLDDIIQLLEICTAQAIVLTHMSRRTHMSEARREVDAAIPARHRSRVFVLMDSRSYHNKPAGRSLPR